MILQDALCDIKDRLLATGYFFKFYEYASMVERDGITRPAYFIDGENFVDVMDFDRGGSGYIRKTGTVSVIPSTISTTSCNVGNLLEIRYPLRAVLAVPKDKLENNGFSDDILALELFGIFHGTQPGINNVNLLKGKVLRYETDRNKIYRDEAGAGNIPHLELSYICIDFELNFSVDVSCLEQICY